MNILILLALMLGNYSGKTTIVIQPPTCYQVYACVDVNGNDALCVEEIECPPLE